MPVQTLELVFNDSPSKYNKDLIDFIKRNIKSIILKGQIKFKYIIADPNNLESLRNKGITRLPVLFVNKKHIIGVPNIIDFIQNRVKNSKSTAIPKSEEEVLNDYFKNTLGSIKHDKDGKIVTPNDDDDDYNENDKLMDDLQKEVKKRENSNKMTNAKPSRRHVKDDDNVNYNLSIKNNREDNILNEDPVSTFNKMKKNGDRDDDMMSALLEKIGDDSNF